MSFSRYLYKKKMFNCKVHSILNHTFGSSFLEGRVGQNNTKLLRYFKEY